VTIAHAGLTSAETELIMERIQLLVLALAGVALMAVVVFAVVLLFGRRPRQ
jgi:hypothetical protein